MLTARKSLAVQRLLILATLGLAGGYFGIHQPLQRRATSLEAPLADVWRELNRAHVGAGSLGGLATAHLDALLWQANRQASNFATVSNLLARRLELDPALRARLGAPFQLVAYENERQLRLEQLEQLAKAAKTRLSPGSTNWFPAYTDELKEPPLLWANLWFADELARSAIAHKHIEIRSLSTGPIPLITTNEPPPSALDEVRVRIETVGSMESISAFLRSLPLRPPEIKSAGLPDHSPTKPVFSIDRVLIRKEAGEPPDAVSLDLRVRGFFLRIGNNPGVAAARPLPSS